MGIFLKNKNYRKFTVASWLSGAGNILFYLALITYASKLKNYALAISLISIMEGIPDLLQSFSGYLADRTRNKYYIIFCLAIFRFILYMIVGLLFVTNISGWNLILIVIAINFVSDLSGMYSGGLQTPLIVDLVGKSEISEAEGFTNGINQLITMIAQFIGSGLLLFMSYSNLAIINALTFLVAGLLYLSVGKNYHKEHDQEEDIAVNDQSFVATMISSFKQTKKANGLLTVVVVIAMLNGILSAIEPLISIIIAGNKTMVIGNFSFTIALVGAIVSIGVATGSALGSSLLKNVTLFQIALLDLCSSAIVTIAMLNRNIIACLISIAILGFFTGVAGPKLMQWLVNAVDRKVLASSIGFLNTILVIAGPLTSTIFSSIAGATQVNYSLYGILLLSLTVFAVTLTVMRKVNKKKQADTVAD